MCCIQMGEKLPSMEDICKGPFVELPTQPVDVLGINQPYMDMIFRLMQNLIGVGLWTGKIRCGRDPAYSNKMVPVGSFDEMVTQSDQALLCWAYCNYVESVEWVCVNHGYAGDLSTIKGVYSAQANKVGNSWTEKGKVKWNEVRKTIRDAWEIDGKNKKVMVNGEAVPAARAFKKQFRMIWMASHGTQLMMHGGTGGGQEAAGAAGPSVEMDLLDSFIDTTQFQVDN